MDESKEITIITRKLRNLRDNTPCLEADECGCEKFDVIVDDLWELQQKIFDMKKEVFKDATDQDLREELKLRGYYVDNLWSTHDVSQNYNVTETEAQEILDEAMTSEYITGEVFTSIDEIAHSRGIKKVIHSQEFTDDDVKKYQSDAWTEAQRDSGDEG
tara:strand:+ start:129 stop:605 length:477 start_codon:yes stop_codon:yes gene_type:complete